MSATIAPRIDLENRTPLETVIPLGAPFVLQVEPARTCNLACRFCPVGSHHPATHTHRKDMLSMARFRKAIDGLAQFEAPLKSMHLYGNGEPLLNRDFERMVRYAKASGCIGFVDTTTNGLLLHPKRIDAILATGIDKINISVNGLNADQYHRFAGARINFSRFLENLRYLYENRGGSRIFIKSIAEMYDREDRKRFFDLFAPIADTIYLENLTDPWPDHDVEAATGLQSTKSAHSDRIAPKQVCCPIFYTLVMNADGSFSLCCVDWQNRLIIGDIDTSSIKEIWGSEPLLAHQVQHLKGERHRNPVCRDCNQIAQCVVDDIDAHRLALLERLHRVRPFEKE